MKFQQWLISDETKESIYNLHKKLYEAARESKKPTVKEMANFTFKSYYSFIRELNPWDTRAKLSVDAFAAIVACLHRDDILDEFVDVVRRIREDFDKRN